MIPTDVLYLKAQGVTLQILKFATLQTFQNSVLVKILTSTSLINFVSIKP